MANGIVIHITAETEKRTEFFASDSIRIGTEENCDLRLFPSPESELSKDRSVWLELEKTGRFYRVAYFKDTLDLQHNDKHLVFHGQIADGDKIEIPHTEISLSFFPLTGKAGLVASDRAEPIVPFIEQAALGTGTSNKRDDAKVFLREFVRELSNEISWTTKLTVLAIVLGTIGSLLYLGFAFNRELQRNREQAEEQRKIVEKLEEQLTQTGEKITKIDEINKTVIGTISLGTNMSVNYGKGVCLIAGNYDLVDKKTGKPLRYPDPTVYVPNPNEPQVMEGEDSSYSGTPSQMLTTEGNGTIVEYDFVGTGFHVGNGFILTNRHVIQPWAEDDQIKQMAKSSNGRPRLKRLVIYFPGFPQPFPLRVTQIGQREDVAVGVIDQILVSPDIPVLPLENSSEAVAIGKTVVSMGYPNGPDRLLAMVDDAEARKINSQYGSSRQHLIDYLAQSNRIQPLTTQGAITDLDSRRIVHDAKTAEGGSGAPLFGQSGKVIGVNFGVFTESTAANMAIPIRFAIDLLHRAGWKSVEEIQAEKEKQQQLEKEKQQQDAAPNANAAIGQNPVAEKLITDH